jgi:predicted ATPase
MKIHRIGLSNFRCFQEVDIQLSDLSIFVGANNAGKSSILRAISFVQAGNSVGSADIRVGEERAEIRLHCNEVEALPVKSGTAASNATMINIFIPRPPKEISISDQFNTARSQIPDSGGACRIVPYYSKRKMMSYSEDVRSVYASGAFNMTYLASKLFKISVHTSPGYDEYIAACKLILGFVLSAIPSDNGARPGILLPDGSPLYLEQMGEGVASIAALLIELVTSSGKIFLIEEPENDLHPSALKALIEIILASAGRNQFIVTTHSNIVVQYLGTKAGALFEVSQSDSRVPTATVRPVPDTVSARTGVLRNLGYSLSDFDLWDGWLILEESSAERIIRDYLIPFFVPRLTNVRILSSDGVDNAEPTYMAFHRMVLYTHLQEVYRHTTWVRLDGDDAGEKVIAKLRSKFAQASEGQFGNFAQPRFENYYPVHFADRVDEVFSAANAQERREQKKRLLLDVIAWLDEDDSRAKAALEQSASEIIAFLRTVHESTRRRTVAVD